MNVAFEMIHCDEGQAGSEGQGFRVGDADEQGACQSGAGGDGEGVEVGVGDTGLGQCGSHYGDDGTQVLSAG